MKGPDHKSSLEPDELKQLVNNIRELELALGSKIKLVTKSEKINRKIIRRSIVASKKINKGEKFTLNNLTFKRPAYGLSPFEIKKVLGKISKKISKQMMLLNYEKNKKKYIYHYIVEQNMICSKI